MVDYFVKHVNLQEPIVVVTPNNECVKKARNFQLRLQGSLIFYSYSSVKSP